MLIGKASKKKRVIETIRRIYGAVLSATFFMKKNHFFLKVFFPTLLMHCSRKKMRKKLWCSFFWGQNGPENFFGFLEKSRKNRKKCVFFGKKLMVSDPFSPNIILSFIMQKCKKNVSKKSVKKKGFRFLKLFFKNENWTFIFVHFWN